jgi:TIR domain
MYKAREVISNKRWRRSPGCKEKRCEVSKSIEIFFSYAHEDEEFCKQLEKHLSLLEKQGIINTWHDRNINAGSEWEREINAHLNTAQIILLLVSPDFIASNYCYSDEMERAMKRHERGNARVIPIILRPVYWQGARFGKLQALPTDAKPIVSSYWHNTDEAFFNVAEGIRKVVEELKTESQLSQPILPTKSPDSNIDLYEKHLRPPQLTEIAPANSLQAPLRQYTQQQAFLPKVGQQGKPNTTRRIFAVISTILIIVFAWIGIGLVGPGIADLTFGKRSYLSEPSNFIWGLLFTLAGLFLMWKGPVAIIGKYIGGGAILLGGIICLAGLSDQYHYITTQYISAGGLTIFYGLAFIIFTRGKKW